MRELERRCPACGGDGKVVRYNSFFDTAEQLDCGECQGIGYIPTDQGERIIEFVRRHVLRGESDA